MKKNTHNEHETRHLFALMIPERDITVSHGLETLSLCDVEYATRIYTVLRLTPGERFEIYTEQCAYLIELTSARDKKRVTARIIHASSITSPTYSATLILPLLKKENLETAVAHATVSGITSIMLVRSAKSRSSLTDHEKERLTKVMRAACEQAKRQDLPTLIHAYIENGGTLLETTKEFLPGLSSLHSLCLPRSARNDDTLNNDTLLFYCTPEGRRLVEYHAYFTKTTQKPCSIVIALGPEGGCTPEEEAVLRSGALQLALSPHILRSVDATLVACSVLVSSIATTTR